LTKDKINVIINYKLKGDGAMNRTTQVNEVKAREINAWEDAFKVFVEGEAVHGTKQVERAIKIMNAIDSKFTSTLLSTNDKEVECAHCGFICDCEYYEKGGEYPDIYFQ
jgi:hypothetical protein